MMKKTLLSLFALSASLVGFAANPNPFAYAVSGEYDALTLDVAYSLNTAADKAEVQILKNGTVVKTQEVSATAGENTAEIDLSGLADGDYTWQIAVTGGATTGDAVEFGALRFYHPRGVDVDNSFESPAFGTIYVTEGMNPGDDDTPSTYYSYNSNDDATKNTGLFIFNPDLTGVTNPDGDYAFRGGINFKSVSYGSDFARVRVAQDGRIFVTRCNYGDDNYILYAKNHEDLVKNNKLTSMRDPNSTYDETTYEYNLDGAFHVAPNLGLDIIGSGENLKMVTTTASNKQFAATNGTNSRTAVYNLGNATTLSNPSIVENLSGYTAISQATNVCFDNRGGIWYCQYKSKTTLSEKFPDLIYVDASGEQKIFEYSQVRGGGGIRYSPDFSQIAISTSDASVAKADRTFTIFNISYKEDGTPELEEKHVIKHGIGTNVNDIAWDLAGNIYIVGNSSEYFKGFAVPRADNTFATKAASKYNFTVDTATGVETIGADNAPVEYYNLQGVKVENPENGIFIKKQGNKAVKVIL